MYRVKAFGEFPIYANNQPNLVNPIGELSLYGATFAIDRGIYKGANSHLLTFASFNELTATTTQDVVVPPAISAFLIEIMENLYGHAESGLMGDETIPVKEYIQGQWQEQLQNVDVGVMVTDGNRWFPSYIQFEGTSTTAPYQAKVWFADEHWINEYDLWETRVVPPIENIDRFFDSATAVQALLTNEVGVVDIMARVNIAQGRNPPSQIVTEEYEWHDPTNDAIRIPFPWPVLTYGDGGRNIDANRRALQEYIMANTAYTEDQWQVIFPDIFSATEFIFAPSWQQIAMAEDAVNGGIYSPISKLSTAIAAAKLVIRGTGYTDAYVNDNMSIISSVYKSLHINVIGGYHNRDGQNQINQRWKDYISVSTSSIDFRRMDDATQKFIVLLNQMLQIAETMTVRTSVPRGFLRLVRDDILYVTCTYERTSLIVVSRESMLEKNPVVVSQ
jgi:hypothetical protein